MAIAVVFPHGSHISRGKQRMSKTYYDVSVTLTNKTVVYEGDPPIKIEEMSQMAKGDPYNLSLLTFGSHTGTHMDAPKHFCDDRRAVDELSLEYFLGKAKVFDMGTVNVIDLDSVKNRAIEQGDRILFKTKNSRLMRANVFARDYVYISPEAAQYLVEKEILTVGIDYLTVEQYGVTLPLTHKAFLSHDIVILEGLDLSDVDEGEYELISLPIKLGGGNGSPMRTVLVKDTFETVCL